MEVGIQTDHVDPKELLDLLIQQHMEEQENSQEKRRHSGGNSGKGTSSELMKHYQQQQQDLDAIHRLADGGDTPKSEPDQTPLQRNPSLASGKVRTKQQPSKISFARGSKKCPPDTKPSTLHNNNNRGKDSSDEQSLSDRICQVVWSRKASAPFVTPLGSRRLDHHSSARRGTSPNVLPLRLYFESKPDAVARSQSFKGSSSSGSIKYTIPSQRDPLSRRASGDTVPTVDASSVAHRALLPSLKPKSKKSGRRGGGGSGTECDYSSGEIGIEIGNDYHPRHHKNCSIVGQNFDVSSLHSSTAGSRQNLSSSFVGPIPDHLGGLLMHGSSFKSHSSCHDGEVDNRIRRQISMTLSIPSREDSVRSCSSSKSYGSHSASAVATIPSAGVFPCTSKSITNPIATTSNILASTSKVAGKEQLKSFKLVRYGSNPDVFSTRRGKWKQEEQALQQLQVIRGSKVTNSNRSLVGSNCNIETIFPSGDGGGGGNRVSKTSSSLKEKRKQILSQRQKQNEKVAWVVHLGFSSLLILAITCIVVFLRLSTNIAPPPSSSSYYPDSSISASSNNFSSFSNGSSSFYDDINMTSEGSVRKENENLLQSIQPSLNLHNITTPQPSTHTQQVYDNSNGSEESGQTSSGDKIIPIPNLQSGQSLTRTKEELVLSSSSSSDNTQQGEDRDEQQKSNNETTHLNIMSSSGRGGEGGSLDRSNNNDSSKLVANSINNPSLKTISIRPKRSRPRPKTEERGGGGSISSDETRNSNKIISVLNEKVVHTNVINDTPSGLTKARHLERTIIRFLKNSSSSGMRERRNLDLELRKL